MVDPHDTYCREAYHVGQVTGPLFLQGIDESRWVRRTAWDLDIQHQQRDSNCKYTVTERLDAAGLLQILCCFGVTNAGGGLCFQLHQDSHLLAWSTRLAAI